MVPLVISASLEKHLHLQKCSFSIYGYQYGSAALFFFCFFNQKGITFFFSFVHFFNQIVKQHLVNCLKVIFAIYVLI